MTAATLDASYIATLEARIVALESRAPEGLMSSKTLRFLLALLGVAFAAIVISALADRYLGISTPYLSDFLNLVGLNGGVGSARNVAADHVVPMMAARNQNPATVDTPKTGAF